MDQHLRPTAKARCDDVSVNVAGEQKHLKEEHAGGPDGRSAAEPGQYKFSEDELCPEEEKGAEKNGEGKLEAGKRKSGLRGSVHRRSL